MNMNPITTAPRDGELVLLRFPRIRVSGHVVGPLYRIGWSVEAGGPWYSHEYLFSGADIAFDGVPDAWAQLPQ